MNAARPQDRDAIATLVKHRQGYQWVIPKCPFCGRKHYHGGGGPQDEPRDFLGWRVPHCLEKGADVGMYQLVEATP